LEKSINNISRSKSTARLADGKKEKDSASILNHKEGKENIGII